MTRHTAQLAAQPSAQPVELAAPAAAPGAVRAWPVALLALPAFVAIWSGWVGLGGLTGFGKVNPLPGTPLAGWTLDTAITLPIGMEVYAAFALRAWLAPQLPERVRRFAKWSAIGSLALGAAGQVAYHLMTAAGVTSAPWWITTVVACLPVAVLGMGAALAHLIRDSAAATAPDGASLAAEPDARPRAAEDAEDAEEAEDAAAAEIDGVPAPRPAPRAAVTLTPGASAGAASGSRGAGSRGASGARTAAAVVRLRERHPDWTVGQIAARAGVTDRTVRRHLSAQRPAERAGQGAGEQTEQGPKNGQEAAA